MNEDADGITRSFTSRVKGLPDYSGSMYPKTRKAYVMTPTNWNEFQKFTVLSLDDVVTSDEDIRFNLTGSDTSTSKIYFPDVPIHVTIIDDD